MQKWAADIATAQETSNLLFEIQAGDSGSGGRRSGCGGTMSSRGDRDKYAEDGGWSAIIRLGDCNLWLVNYRWCGANQRDAQITTMRRVMIAQLQVYRSRGPT
jgi:hypothetical protein